MRRMRRRATRRRQEQQRRRRAAGPPPRFDPVEEALLAYVARLSLPELEALRDAIGDYEGEILIPIEDPSLCGPDCPFRHGERPTEPVVQKLGPDDACFCGSGRAVRDCHGRGSDDGVTHLIMPLPPAA